MQARKVRARLADLLPLLDDLLQLALERVDRLLGGDVARESRPTEPQEVSAAELRTTTSADPCSLHTYNFPRQLFGP